MGCAIERAVRGGMETINACVGGFADRDVRGVHRNGIGVVTGINGPQFVVVQFETIVGRDRNRIAVDLLTVDVILHRRIIHRSIAGGHGHGCGQRQIVTKGNILQSALLNCCRRFSCSRAFFGNDQREALLDLAAVGVRREDGDLVYTVRERTGDQNPFRRIIVRISIRSGKPNDSVFQRYHCIKVVFFVCRSGIDMPPTSYLIAERYLR